MKEQEIEKIVEEFRKKFPKKMFNFGRPAVINFLRTALKEEGNKPRMIKEIIEHWDENRNVYCEKGSPRDKLAIYDLCHMIDYVKSLPPQERLGVEEIVNDLNNLYGLLVSSNSPYCDEFSTPAKNLKSIIKSLSQTHKGK